MILLPTYDSSDCSVFMKPVGCWSYLFKSSIISIAFLHFSTIVPFFILQLINLQFKYPGRDIFLFLFVNGNFKITKFSQKFSTIFYIVKDYDANTLSNLLPSYLQLTLSNSNHVIRITTFQNLIQKNVHMKQVIRC